MILQSRYLHHTSHEMQTPRYQDLCLADLRARHNLYRLLDRADSVYALGLECRKEAEPGIAQSTLSRQCREIIRVYSVRR